MVEAEVRIDLAAVRANAELLRRAAGQATLMAVVKAAGYGHGAPQVARAALDAGAGWLGVCYVQEALELRTAGITAPILAWLTGPGTPWRSAVRRDVDLSVGSLTALRELLAAIRPDGATARVHLEVDTGLGRAGATLDDWPVLVQAAAAAERRGRARVVGIWSHLACADLPDHDSVPRQLAAYRRALGQAHHYGLRPRLRHLANSAATLLCPMTRFDLVRAGIALYGVPPVVDARMTLRPAMTMLTRVVEVTGHDRYGPVAIIPIGLRDGLPRAIHDAQVLIGHSRYHLVGPVGADCTAVRVPGSRVRPGDEVIVFGPGDHGEPTVVEWARWAGTIAHELLTNVGTRLPRHFVH